MKLGDFALDRRLGADGSSERWLAKDPTGRKVALKRLLPHLASEARALKQFDEEVRLARRLQHHAIVAVVASGEHEGLPWVASEFVDGLDLKQFISAAAGPLRPSLAVTIIESACAAIDFAQTEVRDDAGKPVVVLHRQLSPDQLHLDLDGSVKVRGFHSSPSIETGVTDRDASRDERIRYLAPECGSGEEADASCDVYSLGAMLFEMCTGKRPFDELATASEVVAAASSEGLPVASRVRQSLPPELVRIVSAATRRKRHERLPNARALLTRLRAFSAEFPAPEKSEIASKVKAWKEKLEKPKAVLPALVKPRLRDLAFDDDKTAIETNLPDSPGAIAAAKAAAWDEDRRPTKSSMLPTSEPLVTQPDLPAVPAAKAPSKPRKP